MGFLIYNDYVVTIQDMAFKQWVASNDALRIQAEGRAKAKIAERLVQKYDLSNEFADTTIFSNTATYKPNALIQLNYSAWISQNYTVGQFVSYTNGNVYRCILNTTANQIPTDTNYWILVGAQLQLQYLQYPYPLFDIKQVYSIGDRVYWNGKIYQCLIATILPNHFSQLQAETYANIGPYNVFPDDKVNGAINWGAGVPYSVSGIYPNFVATQGTWSGLTTYTIGDTVNYNGKLWQALTSLNLDKIPGDDIKNWQSITWVVGDNRNQSIIDVFVGFVLWYLSPRIAPKVVPQWVESKYIEAKQWLQDAAEGNITLDVPLKQPLSGARIRYGGGVKQNNNWN